MRTASASWRWVTNLEPPGLRLSSQTWMSSGVSFSPGGQPSTTQPKAGPWLSPQVVTWKRRPKVLCDMGCFWLSRGKVTILVSALVGAVDAAMPA